MNKNFIIILFFAMIIVGAVIYTNSKDEKDSGDDKPETLTFEVVGITVSKTENYKPWFTETYTSDEYIAMSQGANFAYTFKINGGVDLLQNLSITRKRADGGSDQIEEVPESKWVEAQDINVDFSVQTGENAKGEHEFSINYTTPDNNVARNMPYTINITEDLLSVKLADGGVEELEMVPVETSGINVAFSAEREEIYIYDSEEVVNFAAQGPVYMSPVEGTNSKGFRLEGVTGIPDTLYRVKYRGGYLLALSESANFTSTEYLSTDKSKKKFTDGELNNKLFYITADANSAEAAKDFFFDLAENVGSSGSGSGSGSGSCTYNKKLELGDVHKGSSIAGLESLKASCEGRTIHPIDHVFDAYYAGTLTDPQANEILQQTYGADYGADGASGEFMYDFVRYNVRREKNIPEQKMDTKEACLGLSDDQTAVGFLSYFYGLGNSNKTFSGVLDVRNVQKYADQNIGAVSMCQWNGEGKTYTIGQFEDPYSGSDFITGTNPKLNVSDLIKVDEDGMWG